MLYPENIEELLDFDALRKQVVGCAISDDGKKAIENQEFWTERDALNNELYAVQEIKALFEADQYFPTTAFVKMDDVLEAFSFEGMSLTTDQLVRLYHIIKGTFDLHKFFTKKENVANCPIVTDLFSSITVEKQWYLKIEKILDIDKKVIKSNASETLIKIRTKQNKLNRSLDTTFNKVLKEYSKNGWLADQKESWRSGRRVLSVLAENKRKVSGIVLDISGNGAIAFIEPVSIQPIVSELSELEVEERKEIERILRKITEELFPFKSSFTQFRELIIQIDIWQAKSTLAIKQHANRPELTENQIEYHNARHAILEKHLRDLSKAVVPLNIKLSASNRIIVISGPNAGGKSVAMKTVGLLQLMAQFGLHLPTGEGSKTMVFTHLMADIGDDQSIEDDLSTYSSHLLKMADFTKHANERTLFLIDEMGSGTDPAFGGSIAEAIMESLAKKGAYGVVTTHYSNLKEMALQHSGIINAAMSFEISKLKPTYELLLGQAGASYALEVAQRSGLNAEIINAAKEKLGGVKKEMESSLSEIQSEKQYLKGIRKNNQKQQKHLDRLLEDYEKLKANLERNKKKMEKDFEEKLLKDYNEANRELENYIRESKEKNQNREAAKVVRKKIDAKRQTLSKKVSNYDIKPFQENETPIVVGSTVKLEDNNRLGKVIKIRKNRAAVQFGNITTDIPLNRLVHCIPEGEIKPTTKSNKTSNSLEAQSKFNLELDIRGKYKDEAMQSLEQFLDRAVMFGIDHVRIIHGKGTGVLKDTVRQSLKVYPYVSNFKYEEQQNGGDGVTLVDLS